MRTFTRVANMSPGLRDTGDEIDAAHINELQQAAEDLQTGTVPIALAGIEGALGDGRRDQRIFNVRDDGASGDNNTDDTGSILASIERGIAAGGGTIYLPGGRTYLFDPAALNKIKLSSNLRFLGDGESSVLKVKPNAGNYVWMLGPSTHGTRLEHILIQGICFDQNTENQELETDPLGAGLSNAQIAIAAFNASDITVDNCWFRCCGVNTVLVNGGGYSDVKGVSINDCRFRWNVLPNSLNHNPDHRNYDNSAIYIVADTAIVSRNRIIDDSGGGAFGACEFHGPHMQFVHNAVDGYESLLNLGTLYSSYLGSADWVVEGNIGQGLMKGITAAAASGGATDRIIITDNLLAFDTGAHAGRYCWGISIGGDLSIATGSYSELDISHNLIHYEPDDRTTDWKGENLISVASHMYFSGLWVWAIGGVDTGRIESNTIVNAPTHAMSIGVEGAGPTRNMEIGGNILKDCGRMKSWATSTPAYFNILGEIEDVWIRGDNVIIDSGDGMGGAIGHAVYRASDAATSLDATNLRIDEGPVQGAGAAHLATSAFYFAPTEFDRTFAKATIAPGTINSATTYSTTVTMTGAKVADTVVAVPAAGIEDGLFFFAYVSSANTVTLKIRNNTGGNIAASSRTWRFRRFRTELDV